MHGNVGIISPYNN